MTEHDFRKLALTFEGAEEREHMRHPDFRVGGKIFATLGYPSAEFAMVKLTPDQQDLFVQLAPDTFKPVKGAWGAKGATIVILKNAKKKITREALRAAWALRSS
jgi:YjbR protein